MLSSRIGKLADAIMENETNPNIDKDIIVYGLNSAIQLGASAITTITLGLLFGLTLEIIVFMVSFTFIRTYAGGYHCKKAISCYLMSSVVIVGVLSIAKFIPNELMLILDLTMLVIAIPILYKFAPIEALTKPLDIVEKKFYRRKTLFNLSIECFLITILLSLNLNTFAFVMSFGILISAGLVVIQKVITNNLTTI